MVGMSRVKVLLVVVLVGVGLFGLFDEVGAATCASGVGGVVNATSFCFTDCNTGLACSSNTINCDCYGDCAGSRVSGACKGYYPPCVPSGACAVNTCVGSSCSDGCNGTVAGTKTGVCGDGVIECAETCDDGNTVNGDGCSSLCKNESYNPSYCGDGIIFPGFETCDDGNKVSGDGCSSLCKNESYNPSYCGDGVVFPGFEECDDGNKNNFDGCSNKCLNLTIYWTDMGGNPISDAELGDSVKMVVKRYNNPVFDIKEKDLIIDDDIRLGIMGDIVGSDVVGIWEISEADMTKTKDYDKFYFTAVGLSGYESGYLNVNQNQNNTPMDIEILSPLCGNYSDIGTNLSIVVRADDPDDVISGTLTIDGDVFSFSNGGITINRVFDNAGDFQIVAEAMNARGERARAISNIMILDKIGTNYPARDYIAACIAEPEDFGSFSGNSVEFNASTTRGVRTNGGPVLDILIPGVDVFSWHWVFYPEGGNYDVLNSNSVLGYEFVKQFASAGAHSASLRVEI